MTDYFARLGQTRRPWLDAEPLKQKFLALASEAHPDHFHHLGETEKRAAQELSAELNAAYQCLREPRDRLRHLLELERGAKPNELQEIPPALMDVFLQVSTLCRQVDAFLTEKAAVTSPLLKVQMFGRAQAWTEELAALQQKLSRRREEMLTELQVLDEQWLESGPDLSGQATLFPALEGLYRLFSYFGRWQGQIQERFLRLSL